jgi:hypothetical protein
MTDTPMTKIPTDLYMALVKLLDVIPPVLCDWIETTGYGEINARDRAALAAVEDAAKFHRAWLAAHGITVDGPHRSITATDIERMKRQGYLGQGWAR